MLFSLKMHRRLHLVHHNTCNIASYLLFLACKIKDWYRWWNIAATQALPFKPGSVQDMSRLCIFHGEFSVFWFFNPNHQSWFISAQLQMGEFQVQCYPTGHAARSSGHKSYLHFNQAIIYSTLPRTFLYIFGHF